MMRKILALSIALLLLPAIAVAVGPLDGSYTVDGFNPELPEYPAYIVVLQNGDQIGFAVLDTLSFGWSYGFGALHGNRVTGDLFSVDNSVIGRFDLTFGPDGVFNGTITDILLEIPPIPVTGQRFF